MNFHFKYTAVKNGQKRVALGLNLGHGPESRDYGNYKNKKNIDFCKKSNLWRSALSLLKFKQVKLEKF
jgi:hypothetical protein